MKVRQLKKALILAAAMALPGTAMADRGTALQLVGAILSLFPATAPYGYGLLFAGGAVRSSDQRRDARRELRRQQQKYNDSLQARNISLMSAEPPYRCGYGRCIGAGDVMAIFTTDKVAVREDSSTFTKPDALKHLVMHFSSRQIAAIHEIYIDNVPLGTLALQLDGSYAPTGGAFAPARNDIRTVLFTGSTTVPEQALEVLQSFRTVVIDGVAEPVPTTITGGGFTLDAGSESVTVTYRVSATQATVRVSKFLGSPNQTVDAYLSGILPTKWTSNHRGRGRAGIVITLDLEDPRFQGGIPNITIDASWSLVYDRRLDSTAGGSGPQRASDPTTWAWNDTASLCVSDFLASEMGYGVDLLEDIDSAYDVVAANACEASITLNDGTADYVGKTYTCNGTFSSESSRESVLADLEQAMAGVAVPAGQWLVMAGVWQPPVREFVDDDLDGSIEVLQADTGTDALLNGARGRYIPRGANQPTEANPPYSNATLVAADQGKQLATDFQFAFTDSNERVRNLLRIKVEKTRSGLIIQYPSKLKHWGVRVGERVYVTSRTYGFARKTFRVTDRRYTQRTPVVFILQEDDPSIWDQADAPVADPTPNTGLSDPSSVTALSNLVIASGTSTLLLTGDGTIMPRARLTWDAITDSNVVPGGRIELYWRLNADQRWQALAPLPGDAVSTYVAGAIQEGALLLVRGRVRNLFQHHSDWTFASHQVVGKAQVPANVAGLGVTAIPGGVQVTWAPSTELDYLETEVRYGASWAAGTQIFKGAAGGFVWPWPVAGSYTVRVKHRDTSRNESAADATAAIVVGTNILIGTPDIGPGAATEVLSGNAVSGIATGATGGTVTFTPPAGATVVITVVATLALINANSSTTSDVVGGKIRVDLDGSFYAEQTAEQLVKGGSQSKAVLSAKYVATGLSVASHTAGLRYDDTAQPSGTSIGLGGGRYSVTVEIIKR